MVGDIQLNGSTNNEGECFCCLVWFFVFVGVEGELILGRRKITFGLFEKYNRKRMEIIFKGK